MNNVHIESLVLTLEGRRLLGQISAAEGLTSIISSQLAMLDISEEWKWDIESARLEKLRDMASRDSDAALLYKEADKIMQRMMKPQFSGPVPSEHAIQTPNFNA